ncbi:Senescence regulator S40 [Dillenia turbinata]|uniref:Senescence regulator S40 n=1 Tax=Dillenia turbinata TaxID=194707 RepID=A0AAN8WDA5_9MAGN
MTSSSLPVNIPDWSKIPRENYRESYKTRGSRVVDDCVEEDDEDDEGDWIPPHENLARTRMASLLVHEGIGRNAILKKVGFQD